MTPRTITLVLTVLAAVVVALARVRLSRDGGSVAGRLTISARLLNVHTFDGLLALVLWVVFLVTGTSAVGWFSLVFWWVAVVAGLLILARWLPARDRHSSGPVTDTWGEEPGRSILAHGGPLVGVGISTAFLALEEI